MTRAELIARLLEVRAESQRSVDLCRSLEGVGDAAANRRMQTRFERHVETLSETIAMLQRDSEVAA